MSMTKQASIRGNTDPDPKWKLRGDIINGRPVYIEAVPNVRMEIQRGPKGEEVWLRHPQSMEPIRPRTKLVVDKDEPVIFREFIQIDLGNGIVQKHYDFEPTPDDIARREAMLNPGAASNELRSLIDAQAAQIAELKAMILAGTMEQLQAAQADAETELELDDLDLPVGQVELKAAPEPEAGSLAAKKTTSRKKK